MLCSFLTFLESILPLICGESIGDLRSQLSPTFLLIFGHSSFRNGIRTRTWRWKDKNKISTAQITEENLSTKNCRLETVVVILFSENSFFTIFVCLFWLGFQKFRLRIKKDKTFEVLRKIIKTVLIYHNLIKMFLSLKIFANSPALKPWIC